MNKDQVSLAIPYPYLESMPGVKSLCIILGAEKYTVRAHTILNENYSIPSFNEGGISVEFMPDEYTGIKSGSLGSFFIFRYLFWYLKQSVGSKIHVGIGLRGGAVSVMVARLLRLSSVYYSMELYCTEKDRALKSRVYAWVEKYVCKYADILVIQDDKRADILKRNYGIKPGKILILPNTHYWKARRQKSDYLHKEHGLPADRKIMLNIGALSDTCCLSELVNAFQMAPPEWILVIHSKWNGYDEVIERYIDRLRKLDINNRVIIRTHAVPMDELTILIDSADIGVALYSKNSENVNEVGLSSGKIGHYLASGLPIVVSNQDSLKIFTDICCAGVSINSGDELNGAISRIFEDYEGYSGRAIDCFNKHYSVEVHKSSVIKAFSRLPYMQTDMEHSK